MGGGIAQVSAAAGFKTIVREVNQAALEKGMSRMSIPAPRTSPP
jgi:3-hydroxybutyryl-CoA dehydrogenase